MIFLPAMCIEGEISSINPDSEVPNRKIYLAQLKQAEWVQSYYLVQKMTIILRSTWTAKIMQLRRLGYSSINTSRVQHSFFKVELSN